MTRVEIIDGLQKYFGIFELVDKKVYNTFGETSWQFFDTDTLHVLLVIREGIGKPIDINNWKWNGQYQERGLRTNIGYITKKKTLKGKLYLSGHVLGKAFDFKIQGMNSDDVRKWIVDHQDIIPCKVRLENMKLSTGKTISWVHVDTKFLDKNPKVYLFNI